MSGFKNFKTWREEYLQFRADAFNLFNTPSNGQPTVHTLGSTAGHDHQHSAVPELHAGCAVLPTCSEVRVLERQITCRREIACNSELQISRGR